MNPYRGFLSFIGYAIISFLAVFYASKLGWIYGVLLSVFIILAVIFINRASIFTLFAQTKFISDKGKAFLYFEKAYNTKTMKPKHALLYAYLLLRDGQLEKSNKIISEILAIKNNSLTHQDVMNARLNKALIVWKSKDVKKAIEKIENLYNSNFKTTALYGVLGYLYMQNNNLEKALEFNLEAVDYNETDHIILDNLGQNYYLLGDTKKAEEIYISLLDKNPNFIEPYYNYGLVLLKKGENQKAKEMFEKALTYKEKFLSTVTHKQVKDKLFQISD